MTIHLNAEPLLGADVKDCIADGLACCIAQNLAHKTIKSVFDQRRTFWTVDASGVMDDVEITFVHNGVQVIVRADSDPELIYRDWKRALNGYIDNKVGPYPRPVLTPAEVANDARVEEKNERRQQEREAEYRAKEEAKRDSVNAKLADALEIEIVDQAAWQAWKDANTDDYGAAVISYAERWARLMQVEVAAGHTLENIADETSHTADLEGITGNMYGAAVATLSQVWIHGDQLRRWHNLVTQRV